jgi:hypothetical protein
MSLVDHKQTPTFSTGTEELARNRTPMLPIADMRHVVAAERTTRVGPGEGRACPRGIERLAVKRARHDAGGRRHRH